MKYSRLLILLITIVTVCFVVYKLTQNKSDLPMVAIANYGPHSSLTSAISGIKQALVNEGFIEGKTVNYSIMDVGFEGSLIPQMIAQLNSLHPKVMVVVTTPVAQFAKSYVHNIPIVFTAITDPLSAGLVDKIGSKSTMVGSSDKQDLSIMLNNARHLIPRLKTIGLMYSTKESNDKALLEMMVKSAEKVGINVLSVAINEARDIPMALCKFKGKVDLIYVGASGPIQPALPLIAHESKRMGIPVLNMNETAVKEHKVLASFGVDYNKVGRNAGSLVASLLKGEDLTSLTTIYPKAEDHRSLISRKQLEFFGLSLPEELSNSQIVG
jgi:putative tryptophan/tyrosine transport system substrate-binding protein